MAALGAAVLICLQLTANYWLYPYIVWFFPLVAVALFAAHPEARPAPEPPAVDRREPVALIAS